MSGYQYYNNAYHTTHASGSGSGAPAGPPAPASSSYNPDHIPTVVVCADDAPRGADISLLLVATLTVRSGTDLLFVPDNENPEQLQAAEQVIAQSSERATDTFEATPGHRSRRLQIAERVVQQTINSNKGFAGAMTYRFTKYEDFRSKAEGDVQIRQQQIAAETAAEQTRRDQMHWPQVTHPEAAGSSNYASAGNHWYTQGGSIGNALETAVQTMGNMTGYTRGLSISSQGSHGSQGSILPPYPGSPVAVRRSVSQSPTEIRSQGYSGTPYNQASISSPPALRSSTVSSAAHPGYMSSTYSQYSHGWPTATAPEISSMNPLPPTSVGAARDGRPPLTVATSATSIYTDSEGRPIYANNDGGFTATEPPVYTRTGTEGDRDSIHGD